MKIEIKFLKPGDKFRFKDRKTINEFIKDDRLEIHYKNKYGEFQTDYYNEKVIKL